MEESIAYSGIETTNTLVDRTPYLLPMFLEFTPPSLKFILLGIRKHKPRVPTEGSIRGVKNQGSLDYLVKLNFMININRT